MIDDLASDAGRSQSFKETAIAVKGRLKTHRGTVFAAAVAFFAFLALIPALTGIIGFYGLVSDPTDVTRQVTDALSTAPETTRDFIVDQMTSIASGNSGARAVSVVVSALVALFSASGAVANLIKALNVAYELEETRKPWTLRGLAFGLMLGGGEFAGTPWGRMPPNGRRMELDAVALVTVEDGFVVRNELVYDSAAVASQLGFRPGGNAAGDRWRAGMATMLNRWRSRAL